MGGPHMKFTTGLGSTFTKLQGKIQLTTSTFFYIGSSSTLSNSQGQFGFIVQSAWNSAWEYTFLNQPWSGKGSMKSSENATVLCRCPEAHRISHIHIYQDVWVFGGSYPLLTLQAAKHPLSPTEISKVGTEFLALTQTFPATEMIWLSIFHWKYGRSGKMAEYPATTIYIGQDVSIWVPKIRLLNPDLCTKSTGLIFQKY